MTTLAEMRTAIQRELRDPDAQVFTAPQIDDFINHGIAEVSRLAPQRFYEDIPFVEGERRYRVRGGTGNLIVNPSFEIGDDSVLVQTAALAPLVDTGDAELLLEGWRISHDMKVYFPTSTNKQNGRRVGVFEPVSGASSRYMFQHIPVNPDTVYLFSAYHWKSATGGLASVVQVDTLDENEAVVSSAVISHSTTSATPVQASGSVTIPSSGVSFLRVRHILSGVQPATLQRAVWDQVILLEQAEAVLVSDTAAPQIEVTRVEVWDTAEVPERYLTWLQPASGGFVNASEAGWEMWGGYLYLPDSVMRTLNAETHILRVKGYAPYDRLLLDSQTTDLTDELEFAVRVYARVKSLESLVQQRDLFTQWQTRANASDVSPAALMNGLAQAQEQWRRLARTITVLREAPG